jgi:hypothetical protein
MKRPITRGDGIWGALGEERIKMQQNSCGCKGLFKMGARLRNEEKSSIYGETQRAIAHRTAQDY